MRAAYPGKSDAEAARALAQKDGFVAIVRYRSSERAADFTDIGTCRTEAEIRGYLTSPHCHDAEIIYDGRDAALRITETLILGGQCSLCKKVADRRSLNLHAGNDFYVCPTCGLFFCDGCYTRLPLTRSPGYGMCPNCRVQVQRAIPGSFGIRPGVDLARPAGEAVRSSGPESQRRPADYQPLIARAVAGLETNTAETRNAFYARARQALVAQLEAFTPALSESELAKERAALDEAIRKTEAAQQSPASARSSAAAASPKVANVATESAAKRNWYRAATSNAVVRQVVLTIPASSAIDTKFGSFFLRADLFPLLATEPWCAGLFGLDGNPGPYLMVRAAEFAAAARAAPMTVAFTFCHSAAGGLFAMATRIESETVGVEVRQKFPHLAPHKYPIAEWIMSLESKYDVTLVTDFLSRPELEVVVCENSGHRTTLIDPNTGTRRDVRPPQATYELHVPLDGELAACLAAEWQALQKHHAAVPAGKKNFNESVAQLSRLLPGQTDPILPRPGTTGAAATPAPGSRPVAKSESAAASTASARSASKERRPIPRAGGFLLSVVAGLGLLFTAAGAIYWWQGGGSPLILMPGAICLAYVAFAVTLRAANRNAAFARAKSPGTPKSRSANGPPRAAIAGAQEPSMQEIVASVRRIIDDDDARPPSPRPAARAPAANTAPDRLIEASRAGDLAQVKALLAANADVNAKTREGATALMVASRQGHLEVVEALLAANADVNAKASNGMTALLLATEDGQLEVVRALLLAKADVNAKDPYGVSVLNIAFMNGRQDLVDVLRQLGSFTSDVQTMTPSPARPLGMAGARSSAPPAPQPAIDLGLFFFNSQDENISGNYALHAKRAVSERVAERDGRVRVGDWPVLSGDLFGAQNIQIMLTAAQGDPNATLLDPDLRRLLEAGHGPGFVPYVIGMFGVEIDALQHADRRLKKDGIAGYQGLATFRLPDPSIIEMIGTALTLPLTSLHSA